VNRGSKKAAGKRLFQFLHWLEDFRISPIAGVRRKEGFIGKAMMFKE